MRRHTLYQRCKVEQIDLPRKKKKKAEGESSEEGKSVVVVVVGCA